MSHSIFMLSRSNALDTSDDGYQLINGMISKQDSSAMLFVKIKGGINFRNNEKKTLRKDEMKPHALLCS